MIIMIDEKTKKGRARQPQVSSQPKHSLSHPALPRSCGIVVVCLVSFFLTVATDGHANVLLIFALDVRRRLPHGDDPTARVLR